MGSNSPTSEPTMTSYVSATTESYTSCDRAKSLPPGSEMDEFFAKCFLMGDSEKERMGREFFSPKPISLTGNYWPRYRNDDRSAPQTGSAFVSYLSRPYFSYKVPSKYAHQYGDSKYITIRKL